MVFISQYISYRWPSAIFADVPIQPFDGVVLLPPVELRVLHRLFEGRYRAVEGLPVDGVRVTVFAAVGEAVLRRVLPARFGAVDQLGDEGEGPDPLRPHPPQGDQLLVALGLDLVRQLQSPDPVLPEVGGQDLVAARQGQGRLLQRRRPERPTRGVRRVRRAGGVGEVEEGPLAGVPQKVRRPVLHQVERDVPVLSAVSARQVQNGVEPLLGADGGVWLLDVALQAVREPVVTPGVIVVHPLLDHRPATLFGEDEDVVVEPVAVLDEGAVHLGRHPARELQLCHLLWGEVEGLARGIDLQGRLPPGLPLPSSDPDGVDLGLYRQLQSSCGGGRRPGGVPVEAEDASQGLKPAGIG